MTFFSAGRRALAGAFIAILITGVLAGTAPASTLGPEGLEPEQAGNHQFVIAEEMPNGQQVIYSAASYCGRDQPGCTQVIFRSADGGTTWEQQPAWPYRGFELLVPPDPEDDRVFSIDPATLGVSTDQGASFTPVAPSHQPVSAAISPSFNDGDPSILVGGRPTTIYNDETELSRPVLGLANFYPTDVAFSPGYPDDPRIVAGHYAATAAGIRGAVSVCIEPHCSTVTLPFSVPPSVRVAPDFHEGGPMYAFSSQDLLVSHDGGTTFSELQAPVDSIMWDMTILDDGTLLVGTGSIGDLGEDGLFRSTDGGASWVEIDSPLMEYGVMSLASNGSKVMASINGSWISDEPTIACSDDGGLTWATRCA